MEKLYAEIDALSFEEFEALIQYIDKIRKQRAKEIWAEAQKKVSRLTPESDIVVPKKSSRTIRPAKYRDPADPNNTWSGFGRQPDWMKNHIEQGGDKDDLLIH